MLKIEGNNQDNVDVIISLMQTDQIRKRLESEHYENSLEAIGFSIFEQQQSLTLGPQPIEARLDSSGVFLHRREINKKISLSLQRGNSSSSYLLVVSVFDKDVPLRYVLRIFHHSTDDDDVVVRITRVPSQQKRHQSRRTIKSNTCLIV